MATLPVLAPATQPVTPQDLEIERRVESILGQTTLEEKIDLLGGVNLFDVRGVPRPPPIGSLHSSLQRDGACRGTANRS